MNEAVVATAGRNKKNVVVQEEIKNALGWETASEAVYCCCGFQASTQLHMLSFFSLFVVENVLHAESVSSWSLNGSRTGWIIETLVTTTYIDAQWESELMFQPLMVASQIPNLFIVRAEEAVFSWILGCAAGDESKLTVCGFRGSSVSMGLSCLVRQ